MAYGLQARTYVLMNQRDGVTAYYHTTSNVFGRDLGWNGSAWGNQANAEKCSSNFPVHAAYAPLPLPQYHRIFIFFDSFDGVTSQSEVPPMP